MRGYEDGTGHENFISDKISFKDKGKFMSFLETKTFDNNKFQLIVNNYRWKHKEKQGLQDI